jgi:N-acetyldiaminopimelate deacetylase
MSFTKYSFLDFEKYTKFRQDLHRIPEIGFEEVETKKYLLDYIINLDIFSKGAKITEVAKTGFFIDFSGKAPKESDLVTTIAYRTDLDGLPISEETGAPYSSIHPDRQHACGHDGHMTILVAFLEFYANNINKVPANVNLRFIFQPAEEGLGGASVIIEGKCLEKVQEIYGLHNATIFNVGEIGVAEGTIMARMDKFEINIHAKGGIKNLSTLLLILNINFL